MVRMLVCALIFLFVCGNAFAQEEVVINSGANKVVVPKAVPKKAPKKAPKKVVKKVAQKQPDLSKEIQRYHVVAPGIIRGAQPTDAAFKLLKKNAGVKTIVDLRNEKDLIKKEKKLVEGQGMRFISIPMNGTQEQSPQVINSVLSIITDKARQPIFVHCAAGKDRTGMVFAAYRMKYDHWSQDKAVQEMLSYGYDRKCCSNLEKSLTKWAAQQ